ncbi:MAG: hypothetical protein AB7G06_00830 [Bdellovibrionales bacterium]
MSAATVIPDYTIPFTDEEDAAHKARAFEWASTFPLRQDPYDFVEYMGEHCEVSPATGIKGVTVYKVVHAADLIVADRKGRMLLINRGFPPLGLATIGELMQLHEDGSGAMETTKEAAIRGAKEEANVIVPPDAPTVLMRHRSVAKAAIRRVRPDPEFMAKHGMKEGDYFMVSTAFYCLVVDDLDAFDYKPRSDARGLRVVQFKPETGGMHIIKAIECGKNSGTLHSVDFDNAPPLVAADFAIPDLFDAMMMAQRKLAETIPAFADVAPGQPADDPAGAKLNESRPQ